MGVVHSQLASTSAFHICDIVAIMVSAGGLNFDLPGGAARRPHPVHDAQHQLQMVLEPGSPTLMGLRDDTSATQRAADASGLVLHALVATRTPSWTASGSSPASARTSVRKDSMRWSIWRSAWQLAGLAMRFRRGVGEADLGKDYQWLLRPAMD
jgi:hypothetical protein